SMTLLALFVEWLVLVLVILKVYNNGQLKEKIR
ncbi:zinc ABC transporter permease, partial [Vibrio parahaemolyticus]